MGCPQRFYLGEIRNQIAFTPPTQGTYNIALTKTDASGTSTVATSVADVDTPAGWTMAYDAYFPGGELDNTIFHGIGTAYNGVTANMGEGITGSVGALLSMPLHGNKTLTMKVDNLPKHGWINAGAAAMFFNIYAPGSQYTVRVDGELVAQVSMHDYLDVFYKTWIPHTSSSVTITLEVTGLNSTDEWWNGGIGVSTFLPTVSLSGGGNVDEGGSTTITATRDNPYDASTWASMSTEEQAEALPALTVPLDWSGSAGESDISNRPSEIKIPAGEIAVSETITAADDNTAEWGETAIVAPKNSDQPYIAAVNNNVAINIFDNDFKITLASQDLIVNNDDSDEDGVNDLEDTDGVTNDPGLYELDIKAPTDFVPGASLSISAPSQVKLYTDANKQHPVVGGSWVLGAMTGSLPTKLFVEAVSASAYIDDIVITGLIENPATPAAPPATQSSSSQPVTSKEAVYDPDLQIILVGGLGQLAPSIAGVGDIMKKLVKNGIHKNNIEAIREFGAKDIIVDKVKAWAVLNPNKKLNLIMVGYSFGGGAIYDASVALDANNLTKGKYNLIMTGYIDAIVQGSLSSAPQTSKPIGTASHVNYYQSKQGGIFAEVNIHGDATTDTPALANIDLDLNANTITHNQIDNDKTVRDGIVQAIKQAIR